MIRLPLAGCATQAGLIEHRLKVRNRFADVFEAEDGLADEMDPLNPIEAAVEIERAVHAKFPYATRKEDYVDKVRCPASRN